MIDERIKLLVQRLQDDKPVPARAQRMIADLLAEIVGYPVTFDQLSDLEKHASAWQDLRDAKIEGVTLHKGVPFDWGKFGPTPTSAMQALRDHLAWLADMGASCDCEVCQILRTPIVLAAGAGSR